MTYKYVKIKESYENLSSGRVLYNYPGIAGFPVRLANEIAQRCFSILEIKNSKPPFTIYDPCCGGAYLLTTIGFLHANMLQKIIASDCNSDSLALAKKNLSLLQREGIEKRITELKEFTRMYHKDSHNDALESALTLQKQINTFLEIQCFKRDITQNNEYQIKPDIVITDFPYGKLTHWSTEKSNPIDRFFENISFNLKPERSILAIISDKSQKLKPVNFKQVEYFKLGKRQISIFVMNELINYNIFDITTS